MIERPFGPELRPAQLRGGTPLRHASPAPAVVHSHLSYADIVAAIAVRGPRLVTTEHGIARDDVVYHHSASKARVMAAAHTARFRRFDAAIAVSRATAEAMRDKWHPRIPVTVIPNGIDVDASRAASTGTADPVARAAGPREAPAPPRGRVRGAQEDPSGSDADPRRHRLGGARPPGTRRPARTRRSRHPARIRRPRRRDGQPRRAGHDVRLGELLLRAPRRGLARDGRGGERRGGQPRDPAGALPGRAGRHRSRRRSPPRAGDRPVRSASVDQRWPTVDDMCERIAATYASARAPR